MADLDARSISNRNKLLVEEMTAKMEQVMSRKLDEFRQKLQRPSGQEQSRARRRKEQELKPKPPDDTSRSTRSIPHKTSHAPKAKSCLNSEFLPTKELQACKFSGKGNYLEWEQSMDDWFYYNHVLEEKRLACAMDQLMGDARKWWLQEVYDRWYYNKPTINTWDHLKELLRGQYVPQHKSKVQATTEITNTRKPDQAKVSDRLSQVVFNTSHDVITLLTCPNEAEKGTGEKERCPDDSQSIKTRGYYLDSQKRMKPNLLSLGANCTILSSKPFQGRKTTLVPLSTHEAKETEHFDSSKLFVSNDKMSCASNLTPVPPSELNRFLQDVSLSNNPWKLQFHLSYHYSKASFYDDIIHTKPKRIGERNRDKARGNIKARDKQLSEVVELQAQLSIEESISCPHQDTSQNHIWRPGDYLERSTPMPHEILISSPHTFPLESKMNISSFGSFQTYQWRPGEFVENSTKGEWVTSNSLIQEEPPDPVPLSFTEKSTEHIKDVIRVSHSLSHFFSHDLRTLCMSLIYPEIMENELGLAKEQLELNSCLKTHVKEKYDKDNALVKNEICLAVYSDSITVIIHLLFAKGVDNIAGIKEEPPDLKDLSFNVFERTGIGVISTKELNIFQGSILVEMAEDLRSNPFQEGEDDMILDSNVIIEQGTKCEPGKAKNGPADKLETEEVFAPPAGPMTCSRAKSLRHDIGALLHSALAQEDHSDLTCLKTTLVVMHAREG